MCLKLQTSEVQAWNLGACVSGLSPPGCFTPTTIKLSDRGENRTNSCVLTCMPPTISILTEQCAFEGISSGLNNERGATELKRDIKETLLKEQKTTQTLNVTHNKQETLRVGVNQHDWLDSEGIYSNMT